MMLTFSEYLYIEDHELPALLREVGEWAQKTFPDESVKGKLLHLREEVDELLEAPGDEGEWADCFLLLFDAARKQGLAFNDVANMILRKYKKNRARKRKAEPDGVYHHVKEAA